MVIPSRNYLLGFLDGNQHPAQSSFREEVDASNPDSQWDRALQREYVGCRIGTSYGGDELGSKNQNQRSQRNSHGQILSVDQVKQ